MNQADLLKFLQDARSEFMQEPTSRMAWNKHDLFQQFLIHDKIYFNRSVFQSHVLHSQYFKNYTLYTAIIVVDMYTTITIYGVYFYVNGQEGSVVLIGGEEYFEFYHNVLKTL